MSLCEEFSGSRFILLFFLGQSMHNVRLIDWCKSGGEMLKNNAKVKDPLDLKSSKIEIPVSLILCYLSLVSGAKLCFKFRVTSASVQAATCRPREERDGPVEAADGREEGVRGRREKVGERRERRAAVRPARKKSRAARMRVKWCRLSRLQCGTWVTATQSDALVGDWPNLVSSMS